MQDQLKNLVEAVRSGRGMDEAMLAAQVELLVANNPGRATAHDPATAGPDDLQRRLCATVDACRAICGTAYFTWPQVEEICAVVIRQIAKLEPDLIGPNGCKTHCDCLAGCQCEHCNAPKGWRTVEINGKQYTLDEDARPKTDAEVAILAHTWGVTESQLNAALGRLPKPLKPAVPENAFVDSGDSFPEFVRELGSSLAVRYHPMVHFWSEYEQQYHTGTAKRFVRVNYGLFEEDGSLTATDENFSALPMPPKPAGPPTVLVGLGCKVPQMPHSGVWKQYPADCPTAAGTYEVRLASGVYTVRDAAMVCGTCEFPKALDPMNEVVKWLD